MTTDGGERSLGAPRFDVVLRGYDRRQVDEHVARLQRVLARMRADLDAARSQPFPAVRPGRPGMAPGPMGPPPGARPHPGGPESPDMIGSFTDRMQSILQAAEDEAEEIRGSARREAQAEAEAVRRHTDAAHDELAEVNRQRDAVVAELTRLRGQLEGLLAAPTARFAATPPSAPVEVGEEESRPARPSPRPKPAPDRASEQPLPGASPSSVAPVVDATTALRVPPAESDAGDLFRPASEQRRSAEADATRAMPVAESATWQAEPDHTVMVPTVQRSGDTGSAEMSSGPEGESATGGEPASGSERSTSTSDSGSSEVSETVKVSAVRPSAAEASPRNGRSGSSTDSGSAASAAERGSDAAADQGPNRTHGTGEEERSGRSRTESRSG